MTGLFATDDLKNIRSEADPFTPNGRSGYLDRPQHLWWRKLLLKFHLWTGIGVGLYISLMSVTGAALVFRKEIQSAATPLVSHAAGQPLSLDRIVASAQNAHPEFRVAWILNKENPREAVDVWLDRDGDHAVRLADPVTGKDLGPKSGITGFMQWLADLHFYLLSGNTGLIVNGVGAAFLGVMCVTGAIIWWPGRGKWRRSLTIDQRAKWKRLNWNLHSAVGFWAASLILIWAITGAYFAFPEPFRRVVGWIAPLKQFAAPSQATAAEDKQNALPISQLVATSERMVPGRVTTWVGLPHHEGERTVYVYRQQSWDPQSSIISVALDVYTGEVRQVRDFQDLSPGDAILQWFGYLHFGNFGGVPVKLVWTIMGLAPALLFVTGVLMYWNRVLSKRWRTFRFGSVPQRQARLPVR